jgi:uroporphyrinogen decarboxylase
MNSKQRVKAIIKHSEPDRIPKTLWHQISQQVLVEEVLRRYGRLQDFYEVLDLDIYSVYTPLHDLPRNLTIMQALETQLPTRNMNQIVSYRQEHLDSITTDEVMKFYRHKKFILGILTGVFELSNVLMGIENTLISMSLYKSELKELFQYLADWQVNTAKYLIECGVDAIIITDDWGQNNTLLFSPNDWWELIYPADKKIVDIVKNGGVVAGLHSDGYIMDLLPGIIKMGVDLLHPIQTSAGMNLEHVKQEYGSKLCLMGGLDIRYVLPRSSEEELKQIIFKTIDFMKTGGGFIFCTDHTPQPDTTIDRIKLACEIIDLNGQY